MLDERYADGSLSARLPALRSGTGEHIDTAVFDFMKALASDLHGHRLCLPSLPEVAIKIRRALVNGHDDFEYVCRVVGADPVLAARVVAAANSPLSRAAARVTNLRAAIQRLGLGVVYGFAMYVALQQIFHAQVPDALRGALKREWERATNVAVMAQVLARTTAALDADQAFLAGLFHNIGKLYVLKRAAEYPELTASPAALDLVMSAWHHEIGFALAKHWSLTAEIADAIRDHEAYDLGLAEPVNLTALVCVAERAASAYRLRGSREIPPIRTCASLAIAGDAWPSIVRDVDAELEHLRRALGR